MAISEILVGKNIFLFTTIIFNGAQWFSPADIIWEDTRCSRCRLPSDERRCWGDDYPWWPHTPCWDDTDALQGSSLSVARSSLLDNIIFLLLIFLLLLAIHSSQRLMPRILGISTTTDTILHHIHITCFNGFAGWTCKFYMKTKITMDMMHQSRHRLVEATYQVVGSPRFVSVRDRERKNRRERERFFITWNALGVEIIQNLSQQNMSCLGRN